jgi:hypothetical protein
LATNELFAGWSHNSPNSNLVECCSFLLLVLLLPPFLADGGEVMQLLRNGMPLHPKKIPRAHEDAVVQQ